MNKIIIANWKMNPIIEKEAIVLARALDQKGIVICPPFPFLKPVAEVIKKAELGAQDVFWEESGAYTGEVSAEMLKNLGVEYVIVGHSERRQYLNETDEMINKKVLAALRAGLKVILCIGEPERDLGFKNKDLRKVKDYVRRQLLRDLKGISNLKLKSYILNLTVAYEPIWAIGTGYSDTSEDAVEMIKFIKNILNSKFYIPNSRVLYGGSADSRNIEGFLKDKEIDGVLVGGASLKAKEIKTILKIASK